MLDLEKLIREDNEKKLTECKRFYPGAKEDCGIFNLDISCYFPYADQDQEDLVLGVGLYTASHSYWDFDFATALKSPEFVEFCKNQIYDDTVLNHRYPNHEYVTLSKKLGNKRCKAGYPICAPIEDLNSYNFILIKLGYKDEEIFAFFPLILSLSKEKPVGQLSLIIENFIAFGEKHNDNFGFNFSSSYTVEDRSGWKKLYYIWGASRARKDKFQGYEKYLKTQYFSGNNLFYVEPALVIPGQARDCVKLSTAGFY